MHSVSAARAFSRSGVHPLRPGAAPFDILPMITRSSGMSTNCSFGASCGSAGSSPGPLGWRDLRLETTSAPGNLGACWVRTRAAFLAWPFNQKLGLIYQTSFSGASVAERSTFCQHHPIAASTSCRSSFEVALERFLTFERHRVSRGRSNIRKSASCSSVESTSSRGDE